MEAKEQIQNLIKVVELQQKLIKSIMFQTDHYSDREEMERKITIRLALEELTIKE